MYGNILAFRVQYKRTIDIKDKTLIYMMILA
jgi:hypothetical protein